MMRQILRRRLPEMVRIAATEGVNDMCEPVLALDRERRGREALRSYRCNIARSVQTPSTSAIEENQVTHESLKPFDSFPPRLKPSRFAVLAFEILVEHERRGGAEDGREFGIEQILKPEEGSNGQAETVRL